MEKRIILLITTITVGFISLICSNKDSFFNKNIAALAASNQQPYCHSGGPGASSCTINAGTVIIGYGVATGCDTSCPDGTYACCSLKCTCEKDINKNNDEGNNNLKP